MGAPPDLTMLGASLVLLLLRIIERPEAYQGFSDPGPITVGAMFVVAKALNTVGAMEALAAVVLGRTRSPRLAILWLCGTVALLSAFVNNTPIVAALVPLVCTWARSNGFSPSKLLMPCADRPTDHDGPITTDCDRLRMAEHRRSSFTRAAAATFHGRPAPR